MKPFKVGDIVRVIADDGLYEAYQVWADKNGLSKFKPNHRNLTGEKFAGREGIIVVKANNTKTKTNFDINYLYGVDLGDVEVIGDKDSLELIT